MILDVSMPILVVDDYLAMLNVVRNLLGSIGFTEIDTASDGCEALAMARRRRYALVISDLNMPHMSGHDLLCEMRRDSKLAGIPVILIGAAPKSDSVVAAMRDGASAFIVKPFSAKTLMTKIEHACRAAVA